MKTRNIWRGLATLGCSLALVLGFVVPANAWVWKPLNEPNSFGKGQWVSEGSDGAQPVAQPTYTWSCPAKLVNGNWVPSSSGNTHTIWGTSTNFISGQADGMNFSGLPSKFLPYGNGAQFPTTIPQSFTDQYNHYFGLAAQNGVNLNCSVSWVNLFKPKDKTKSQSDWNTITNAPVFVNNAYNNVYDHNNQSQFGFGTTLMVHYPSVTCKAAGYQKHILQDETDPWKIYLNTLSQVPGTLAGCQYEKPYWDAKCTADFNQKIKTERNGGFTIPGANDYYRAPGTANDGRPVWTPKFAWKPGKYTGQFNSSNGQPIWELGNAYGPPNQAPGTTGNCGQVANPPAGYDGNMYFIGTDDDPEPEPGVSTSSVSGLSSVSPNKGSVVGGTTVTVQGTALNDATYMTVCGRKASHFKVVSNSRVSGKVPAGNAGRCVVRVGEGAKTYPGSATFTYTRVSSKVSRKAVVKKKRGKVRSRQLRATVKVGSKLSLNQKVRIQVAPAKGALKWKNAKTFTIKVVNGKGTKVSPKLSKKANLRYRVCTLTNSKVQGKCSSAIRIR